MLLNKKIESKMIKLQHEIIKNLFTDKQNYKLYQDMDNVYIIYNQCCTYIIPKQYFYLDLCKICINDVGRLQDLCSTNNIESQAYMTNKNIVHDKQTLQQFTNNDNSIRCYFNYKYLKDIDVYSQSYKYYFKDFKDNLKMLLVCVDNKPFILLAPTKVTI